METILSAVAWTVRRQPLDTALAIWQIQRTQTHRKLPNHEKDHGQGATYFVSYNLFDLGGVRSQSQRINGRRSSD